MRSVLCIALLAAFAVAPVRADPPDTMPLLGTRVGGDGHDDRASKRLDTRLPTRLDTRVTAHTFGEPLVAATSQITADKNNGCTKNADAGTKQACDPPR